jgi:transposase
MTVFAGAERRRRWSFDQKRAIVEATLAPGAVVLDIARAADVGANQIYRWRRELGVKRIAPDGFAAVRVEPDGRALDCLPGAVMTIEIGGAVVRISGTARPGLVTAVLQVLR